MENKKEYRSNIAEGEIIIYQAEDGHTKIDVKFVDETVWLTQTQLCELYQTSKSNISEHIKHIFEAGQNIDPFWSDLFLSKPLPFQNHEPSKYLPP